MLSKQTIKLYWLLLLIAGCTCKPKKPAVADFNQNLLQAIERINQSSNSKDVINNDLDILIRKEIDEQTALDSSRYLLKINLKDKYLYTFPVKRSDRLNYHINKLNNAQEVYRGLEDQFNNYFYDSRFNTDIDLAKFYFEQSLPDTTLQRFLDMCILDTYQVIEVK